MPNECKYEANPTSSEVRKTATSEDKHGAINREENEPKCHIINVLLYNFPIQTSHLAVNKPLLFIFWE